MDNRKISAEDSDFVYAEVEKISSSGVLGRSNTYRALLIFLIERSLDGGHPPKEAEIADSVFSKKDFDPAGDASVRVYSHNLRKKLDEYYRNLPHQEGDRIQLAKGVYRIELLAQSTQNAKPKFAVQLRGLLPGLILGSVLGLLISAFTARMVFTEASTSQVDYQIPVWSDLVAHPDPILIVVGDFFVFREFDTELGRERVIRDLEINSIGDFAAFLNDAPNKRDQTRVISNTYLTKGSFYGLQPVLNQLRDRIDVEYKLASAVTADDLREHNIVYIGLFKTLAAMETVLNGSNFTLENNYSVLRKKDGSIAQLSLEGDAEGEHSDHGLFAHLRGPTGNHLIVMASFADTALIQISKRMTDYQELSKLSQSLGARKWESVELIFAARGVNRTDLASEIIYVGEMNESAIWSGSYLLDNKEPE